MITLMYQNWTLKKIIPANLELGYISNLRIITPLEPMDYKN